MIKKTCIFKFSIYNDAVYFMGIKDAILNKMLGKMMKGVDVDAITKNAKEGKYDLNKMIKLIENLIGKEASAKLMKEIQAKAEKGEKVSPSMVLGLIKNVDTSEIENRAKSGEIDAEALQSTLSDLVGEEQTEKIFSEAAEAAKEFEDKE